MTVEEFRRLLDALTPTRDDQIVIAGAREDGMEIVLEVKAVRNLRGRCEIVADEIDTPGLRRSSVRDQERRDMGGS